MPNEQELVDGAYCLPICGSQWPLALQAFALYWAASVSRARLAERGPIKLATMSAQDVRLFFRVHRADKTLEATIRKVRSSTRVHKRPAAPSSASAVKRQRR